MRIPNTYLLNDNLNSNNEKTVKDIPEEIMIPLEPINFISDLEDDKSYKRLIKQIESIVRTSFEYQEFRSYLVNEMNMSTCAYLEGLSSVDSNRIKIELHHTPFTLYDIVEIVVNKHKLEKGVIYPIDIAEEVMELHFRGVVGLIPLSTTVHELVHSGVVFVPLNYIFGNFKQFVEEYEPYIKTETKNALRENIKVSKEFVKVPDILKPKYMYMEDGYSLPKTDIFNFTNE